jgi:hypothetical protein
MKGIQTTLKCPFQFNVSWDQSGYFVILRNCSGQPLHKHHAQMFDPKNIPLPTKLLTEHQVESISNIVDSTCTMANGRNYMFTKFHKFMSQVKLSFMRRNKYTDGPHIDTATDISRMLANFENSDEIKYTVLSDIPISELREDSETCTSLSDTSTSTLRDDS